MEKFRAIPPGFMTVGEVARKMNTTVRTLQYYDKEGILCPSTESEGGRRLYTYKDIVKLHQIQQLKYLGFSLADIKTRLVTLDSPQEIATALAEQAQIMQEKIAGLNAALKAIELLREEVLKMPTVDFEKYAAIIISLQMNNEYYGLIKYFDTDDISYFSKRFDEKSATKFVAAINTLLGKAIKFQKEGVLPESAKGQQFAAEMWAKMMEFTGGDMKQMVKLTKLLENVDDNDQWKKKQEQANIFIEPALGIYLSKQGINPFAEEEL